MATRQLSPAQQRWWPAVGPDEARVPHVLRRADRLAREPGVSARVAATTMHEQARDEVDEDAVIRMASADADTLFAVLFRRYPEFEWATFARFGWRETPSGLVLSL